MPATDTLTRRYVLLRHECPPDYRDGPHWDLMIEDGNTLRTWSLLTLPDAWQNISADPDRAASVGEQPNTVAITELPPHRLAYLEREGEVTGGRGHVKRVARGECSLSTDQPTLVAIEARTGKLHGEWRIEKDEQAWRLSVIDS